MDGNTLKRRLSDCGMNFNVNTKTAACDLSRHREGGVSRSEVQFIPTSEPHQLESGLQKNGGLPVRVVKACACARALTITPTHQRLLTIRSRNMDDSRNSTQFELWLWIHGCPFYYSHPTEWPCEQKLRFEYACWHPQPWPVVAFKWLLLSPAQDGKA